LVIRSRSVPKLRTLLEDFSLNAWNPSQIEQEEEAKIPRSIVGYAKYEYIIGEFASEAGKEKREAIFTLSGMVSELNGSINSTTASEIHSMTPRADRLRCRFELAAAIWRFNKVAIYGQEMNGSSWSMARMKLYIHGIHVDSGRHCLGRLVIPTYAFGFLTGTSSI
jgi:type I restriction enzyme M protein